MLSRIIHKRRNPLDARGDTIIEVLIVLAVLGLALGIAYATANSSLLGARQSQENTQATEIIQGQAEALRSLASNSKSGPDYIYINTPFCIGSSGHVETALSHCNLGEASRYAISITWKGSSTDDFIIKASWDDVSGHGTDTNTLTYRVHQTQATAPTKDHACPPGYSGTWPDCVPPPPGVGISASPTTVTQGSSSTLTWVSSNATSCTASGAWSGAKALTGSASTGGLNSTSTFILKCTGDSGTASSSAKVNVICQSGYTGTPPSCTRIPCPTGTFGTYPDCKPNPCPFGMYQGTKYTYDYLSPNYPYLGYGSDVPPYCVPWSY